MKYLGLDLELVCVSLPIVVRENIAEEESLWRMDFSFAGGIYPMDLALNLLSSVSLRKDERWFIVEKLIVPEYVNCLSQVSFCRFGVILYRGLYQLYTLAENKRLVFISTSVCN